MISLYENNVFEEDIKTTEPDKYSKSGNRLIERIKISGRNNVSKALSYMGLDTEALVGDLLVVSALWHLPRMEYGETDIYVSLDGFTGIKNHFKTFMIADNTNGMELFEKAKDIIRFLNAYAKNISIFDTRFPMP